MASILSRISSHPKGSPFHQLEGMENAYNNNKYSKKVISDAVVNLEDKIKRCEVTPNNIKGLNEYNAFRVKLGLKRFFPPLFLFNEHLRNFEKSFREIDPSHDASQVGVLKSKVDDLYAKCRGLSADDKQTHFYLNVFSPRLERLSQNIHGIKNRKSASIASIVFDRVITHGIPFCAAYRSDLIPMFTSYPWVFIPISIIAAEWIKYEALDGVDNPLKNPLQLIQKHKWTIGAIFGYSQMQPYFPLIKKIWNETQVWSVCLFSIWRLKNSMHAIDQAKTWKERGYLTAKSLAIGAAMGSFVGFFMQPFNAQILDTGEAVAKAISPAVQSIAGVAGSKIEEVAKSIINFTINIFNKRVPTPWSFQ